jgi:hypothetical protein
VLTATVSVEASIRPLRGTQRTGGPEAINLFVHLPVKKLSRAIGCGDYGFPVRSSLGVCQSFPKF